MKNKIYFVCGIPGSGKDWYVDTIYPGSGKTSFDDIRIAVYNRKYPRNGLNSIELYNKAWAYCNSAKVDLMEELINNVEVGIALGLSMFICNTLLTKKSRASMMDGLFKKFNRDEFEVSCLFLTVPSNVALARNANRTSHRLSEEVMNRFITGPQELPLLEEGFDWVNVIHNV